MALPAVTDTKYRSVYRPSKNDMNEMQKRFVDEYLIDLNASQAAIRAGYSSTKAGSASASLMKFAPVREAIARALAVRSRRVGINADRILEQLGSLVLGDTRALFTEDGRLKMPHEIDEMDARMIAGVKTRRVIEMVVDPETGQAKPTPVEMQEIKFVDKVSAIQLAMRHLGMMNDKLDINITSLADRMLAAQMRTGMKTLGVQIEGFVEPTEDEQSKLQSELLSLEFGDAVQEELSFEDLI